MDTTTQLTHISLCAGYGGIDLGLKRVIPDLRTIALSEIEAFACANLVAKMEAGLMEPAPVWTDLKTFPYAEFSGRVDILSGGYPCQPFSAAGKRLGKDDPRHLWPFIADGIRAMRPGLCFFENVEGHISMGLPDVIEDLAGLGYRTTWGIFSASEVGAPHRRKRVFILAYHNSPRLERSFAKLSHSQGWEESVRSTTGSSQCSSERQLAHSLCNGSGESWPVQQGPDGTKPISDGELWGTWPSRPGEPQHGWEPPRVVGNGNGLNRSAPSGGWQHDAEARPAGESVGDTQGQRPAALRPEHERLGGELCTTSTGGEGAMGNTDCGRQSSSIDTRSCSETIGRGEGNIEQTECGKTQPSLGRDADGPAGGLDYAELSVSCDNRTDELRLLGNGVVPATAALAFRTLLQQLLTN